jgi:hypothetical protein
MAAIALTKAIAIINGTTNACVIERAIPILILIILHKKACAKLSAHASEKFIN